MIESLNEILIYLAKIGLSIILGLFVGHEREGQNKPAGIRDVALVSLGATLFTIVSLEVIKIAQLYQPPVRYDLGRIIAYTIVSIGFLGSGVIIQTKNKLEGITTASVLWSMVAVGLLCGIGLYTLAVISALCVYFLLKLKHIRVQIETTTKKMYKKKKAKKK